jgi:hypothetical protein
MYRDEELRMVVADLIHVLQEQAAGLERLTDHLAQRVGRLSDEVELSAVRSELTALHVRAKRLVDASRATA